MSDRLQPAFWAGLFIGVLSALPLVNLGNCCCCLWVLVGGALAAYLRQQNNPYQINAAEGAIVGLMAGAIGGAIYSVLSIPVQMITGPIQQQWMERILASNPDVTPEMRDMVERMAMSSGSEAHRHDRVDRGVFAVRSAWRPHRRCGLQAEPAAAPASGTIDITPTPVAPTPPPPPPPPPPVEV